MADADAGTKQALCSVLDRQAGEATMAQRVEARRPPPPSFLLGVCRRGGKRERCTHARTRTRICILASYKAVLCP